jgi:hypothetical protein
MFGSSNDVEQTMRIKPKTRIVHINEMLLTLPTVSTVGAQCIFTIRTTRLKSWAMIRIGKIREESFY